MKLMTIQSKNEYEFIIENYKGIVGDKLAIVNFFNEIKYYFNKIPQSEYYKEEYSKYSIKIDNREINLSETTLLCFNASFDLVEEYKLGTKSLLHTFLDTLLDNIELNETVQTAQILFDDMLCQLEEELLVDDIQLAFESIDINKKFLQKNLELAFLIDHMKINQRDLDAKSLLQLQKNIFKYLIRKHPLRKYIILDNYSLELSDLLTFKNVTILSTKISNNLEENYNVDLNKDYANEEELYMEYLEFPSQATFDEYKAELINKILK